MRTNANWQQATENWQQRSDSRRVTVIGDFTCCLSGYSFFLVFLPVFTLFFSYQLCALALTGQACYEKVKWAVYRAFVPNATPHASSSSSFQPPFVWHWRVGSLSALQVLNSLTTNKNRLKIAQFALRWPYPSISTDLTDWKPDWLSRFSNANCIDCAARDLGKNWTAGRPVNKPFQTLIANPATSTAKYIYIYIR